MFLDKKVDEGWKLTITVIDKYDFTEWRTPNSKGNIANDYGFIMQKIGLFTPYDINVTYEYDWRE